MKKDAPLMSEALMYAEFHRSSASKENIDRTMCGFFDLIDDLFKLEENNIQVVCVASNWKRLPRINPEEVTQISMADKLAQLKSKLSFYDAALIDVKSSAHLLYQMEGLIQEILMI